MYNSDYNRPPEEREPIETEHFHVWDAESPKPPRKKSGAARFVPWAFAVPWWAAWSAAAAYWPPAI